MNEAPPNPEIHWSLAGQPLSVSKAGDVASPVSFGMLTLLQASRAGRRPSYHQKLT
jgi:hypothetical protein